MSTAWRIAVLAVALAAPLAGRAAETPDRPIDGQVLAEVSRRKAALDRREHDLELREVQAAAAERLARQELAELTTLRAEVEKLVAKETTAAEADMALLVNLYSNMKPVQAAGVLGKMEASKAAAIIRRLDARLAGPILAGMEPTAAASVTDELQARRAAFLP